MSISQVLRYSLIFFGYEVNKNSKQVLVHDIITVWIVRCRDGNPARDRDKA